MTPFVTHQRHDLYVAQPENGNNTQTAVNDLLTLLS